jgi:hypothetical protein
MSYSRNIIAILVFYFICTVNANAITSCEFDEYLMKSYRYMTFDDDIIPRKLLHFIEQYGADVENTQCTTESLRNIRKGASTFIHLDGNHERPKFNAQNFTDEEVVVLNLFFEYVMSKYNSFYSASSKKKHEQKNLINLISELSNVSKSILISAANNPTPQGIVTSVATNYVPSWVYLWIRSDNPFKHNPNYDIDYSWLTLKCDIFLQSFPDSKYSAAAKKAVNNDLVIELRENIKNRLNFHFGLGFAAGKTFTSSVFDPHEDFISVSIIHLRLQFFSFVALNQIDYSIGNGETSIVGVDMFGGYALVDRESFGIDIFGGVGFSDVTLKTPDNKEKDKTYGYLAAGTQVFKRFPLGDVFDVMPKIQWIIKYHPACSNEVTHKEGVGYINQIFGGLSFDVKLPMGKARKKKG